MVLVSPLGVVIADLSYPAGRRLPIVHAIDGIELRDYRSETELVKDLVDQHRRLESEDSSASEPVLSAAGAKVVITGTVNKPAGQPERAWHTNHG